MTAGDEITIDFGTGIDANITTGQEFLARVPSDPAMDIIGAVGLVSYIRASAAFGGT